MGDTPTTSILEVAQQDKSNNGVWTKIDASLASKVADYLNSQEVVNLSRGSNGLYSLFYNSVNQVNKELILMQHLLRLEDIGDMRDFLFDKDDDKISLKPRVKREIQAILRLCELHRTCADAYTSFINSRRKAWPKEHENIAATIAACQETVNPWLLKNNMIDVMQSISDIFLFIKKKKSQGKQVNWDMIDERTAWHLGSAQRDAGSNYVKTVLTGKWKVGVEVDPQVWEWFEMEELGLVYYLYVIAFPTHTTPGAIHYSVEAGYPGDGLVGRTSWLALNSKSHLKLITKAMESLLKQESIPDESYSETNFSHP